MLLGNNKACEVKGIGSIVIKIHDGISRTVQNVRYVPDLKRNLLSIGMFGKCGFTIKIDNGILKVTRGSLVVMKGKLGNGLYLLVG